MHKAVFLDRDDTLIEDVPYLSNPACVRILPGVVEALREFRKAGFLLVVVTNQSGIGRGMYAEENMHAVHGKMRELFAAEGVVFDGVCYCPHAPGQSCVCRKPLPGMLLDAAAKLGIDLSASVMIGDKPSDVEAGIAAGCCRNVLLLHGRGESFHEGSTSGGGFEVADDLLSAARLVLEGQSAIDLKKMK
ncbi:MAG: HAD family hydrolase [Victivallales bacterium]|nr:HAD family hydrolase [Victivallales bacterium]